MVNCVKFCWEGKQNEDKELAVGISNMEITGDLGKNCFRTVMATIRYAVKRR